MRVSSSLAESYEMRPTNFTEYQYGEAHPNDAVGENDRAPVL